MLAPSALAQAASFEQWRDAFRARAVARGVSDATYTRVMSRVQPDMSVFAQIRNQPEFKEQLWQYLNRRVSDWRIRAGKEAAAQNAALFTRIERDLGVARGILLALWGVESAYGGQSVQQNYMKPIFPSLGCAGLERAAAQDLLGNRTHQCAEDRRQGLGHARRHARLMGRRDGPHPMDAGSLAQYRHRL